MSDIQAAVIAGKLQFIYVRQISETYLYLKQYFDIYLKQTCWKYALFETKT